MIPETGGLKTCERLVALWDNGAYVSISQRHSLLGCSSFLGDLADMIRQFGSPQKVELRKDEEHESVVTFSPTQAELSPAVSPAA